MEETPMDQSTNAIETVGLLIGAAQSDTIYRDVYLRRARDSGFKDQIPEDRQASLQNRLAVPLFVAILHEVSEISEKSGFYRSLIANFFNRLRLAFVLLYAKARGERLSDV